MADLYSAQAYEADRSAPGQYLTGQSVVLRLPLDRLRVTSATVEVLHPVTGSTGSPASVTPPSVSATTTAVAERLAKTIPATGDLSAVKVGKAYLLDAPGFPGLEVTVTDTDDGTGFKIDQQLPLELPSGAVLRDTTLTHDVGTLDRARGYRARWTITAADGDVVRLTTFFDVVYQVFQIPLTKADVKALFPRAASLIGDNWPDLVRGATRAVVAELDSRGMQPDRVYDSRPWLLPAAYYIAQVLVLGNRTDGRADLEVVDRLQQTYRERVTAAFNAARSWYDWQDDDARDDEDEGPTMHFWSIGKDGYRTLYRSDD